MNPWAVGFFVLCGWSMLMAVAVTVRDWWIKRELNKPWIDPRKTKCRSE